MSAPGTPRRRARCAFYVQLTDLVVILKNKNCATKSRLPSRDDGLDLRQAVVEQQMTAGFEGGITMNKFKRRAPSAPIFAALPVSAAVLALALATLSYAQTNEPIKIGVIAEAQSVAGSSIPQAAQLAADEINASGGVNGRKIEIVSYDDHSSSA